MQTVNTLNSPVLLDQQSKKCNKNKKSKMKLQQTNLESNSIQSLNLLTFQCDLYTYVLHIQYKRPTINVIVYFFSEKHFWRKWLRCV